MSINITAFISRLMPTFNKSDLENDFEISLDALKTVITSYENMAEVFTKEFSSPKAKALIVKLYKEYDCCKGDLKLKGSKSFAVDHLSIFKSMQQNAELVKKELIDISNEVIVSKALTAFKGNILRAVEHYFFVTRYALDLANYLYTLEAQFGGIELSKSATPNAKQIEFIEKNLWIFTRLNSVYGLDYAKFKSKLSLLELVVVNQDQLEEAVAAYEHSKLDLFDNLPVGFIGSPIYTVRLVWAQWEADRYKQLKDKKKLLELRLLHLKLIKEQGGSDINTERELEYLQKRVTDIDYTTAKIEAQSNG